MPDSRPTVYIETYGCQMNVSDSELMLGRLTASGYQSVDAPDGADTGPVRSRFGDRGSR